MSGDESLAETAPFLEQSHLIAEEICRQAIWHEDRCNWIGAMREEVDPGLPAIADAALGPDLYGGTSGVAIFLANLHAATGDPPARRSALGAMRQALHAAERGRLAGSPGLFTGRLGIALAAVEVGTALGEPSLLETALRLASEAGPFGPHDFDLLSGRAGAVLALLWLHNRVADDQLLTAAAQLGSELLAAGTPTDAGLSWATSGYATHGNLTGLSHGAAGAGYALTALFDRIGEASFRAGAVDAFRYEASLFDQTARNWPDLRAHSGTPPGAGPSFSTFWCHGAPGIALSRLAATEVLGREPYQAEAVAAVKTTADSIGAGLPTLSGTFSLCHGLAGNAEILLAAAGMLTSEGTSWRDLAHRVAQAGIDSYGSGARPWPCGTYGGTTPNLLLGTAGIGLFYLRLHDPLIPTPLLPAWPRARRDASPGRSPAVSRA